MSLTVEKSNRNFEDKDGRQVQVNEGICKVRLHGEYIGAVAQTNYYNDCPSRWKVWEWKSKEDEFKFVQHYNCKWYHKFDGVRNSFSLKRDAVKALVEREHRLIARSDYQREITDEA